MSTASIDLLHAPEEGDVLALAEVPTDTTAMGAYTFETTVNGVVSTFKSSGEVPITDMAQYTSLFSPESASAASSGTSTQNPVFLDDSFATDTATTINTASPGASSSSLPVGDIVAGVLRAISVAVIVAVRVVHTMRRRRRVKRAEHAQMGVGHQAPFEQAQLHGIDIKSNSELKGVTASARFLQKRPGVVAELPANEKVSTTRDWEERTPP